MQTAAFVAWSISFPPQFQRHTLIPPGPGVQVGTCGSRGHSGLAGRKAISSRLGRSEPSSATDALAKLYCGPAAAVCGQTTWSFGEPQPSGSFAGCWQPDRCEWSSTEIDRSTTPIAGGPARKRWRRRRLPADRCRQGRPAVLLCAIPSPGSNVPPRARPTVPPGRPQ
jgi:hypothetical protein